MAITSVGYDGTVDEAQWASMVSKVGGYEYGVDAAGHFAVTQSAGTRMISVAAGLAWGRGVMDISDAASVIQLDEVATGVRYDLVALRRTWGPANGGPTEIVVVKGTSTKALPSGRQASPGVIDDQPLALVRVQSGSASIPEIIDLRVWGRNGGQLYAKNDLVRSYIDAVGTEINIDGVLWQLVVGANNTAVWSKLGLRSNTGLISVTSGLASGWALGQNGYLQYQVLNGIVQFKIRFQRTGGTIPVYTSGNIDGQRIAVAPVGARPGTWAPLQTGSVGPLVAGAIRPDGAIDLESVSPGLTSIKKGDEFTLGGTYIQANQ